MQWKSWLKFVIIFLIKSLNLIMVLGYQDPTVLFINDFRTSGQVQICENSITEVGSC